MTEEKIVQEVKIDTIVWDPTLTSRIETSIETVDKYLEVLQAGMILDPIILFYDGDKYYPGDGWHRAEAHRRDGKITIQAIIKQGGLFEAFLYASGPANSKHGLPLTHGDKKRRIQMILLHPELTQWSQTKIAKHCRVSQTFVSMVEKEMKAVGTIKQNPIKEAIRKNGKTFTINTANLGGKGGRKKKPEVPNTNKIEDQIIQVFKTARGNLLAIKPTAGWGTVNFSDIKDNWQSLAKELNEMK